ncbi:MAG: hypothetical protein CMJ46_06310 [Planctomyces sp.]|nr:hypothetical protein [Planctomyces sp.]
MRIDFEYVESFDGTRLLTRRFHAINESAAQTLLFTHGLNEHGGRYEHFAMYCADRGFQIILHDLRGHGQSSGPRMHVDRFADFCADLTVIRQHFELDADQLTMVGHSLGGLITARDAQLHPDARSRLVLLSPFLGMVRKPPVWKWYAGKLLSNVSPRTLFATEIDASETTTNPASVAKRAYDPLGSEVISAGLFFECQRALNAVWQQLGNIRVPTLLFQSQNDSLVNAVSAMSWLNELHKISPASTTGKSFIRHKHELLNEADWEETADAILDWIVSTPARDQTTSPVSAG